MKRGGPPAALLRAMADSTASVMVSTIAFMEGAGEVVGILYLGLENSDSGETLVNSLSFLLCLRASECRACVRDNV
jgi:hypothetical protein